MIHGTRDRVVGASNAYEAARQWAEAAGAKAAPARVVQRGRRWPMTVVDFKRGRAVAATLIEIDGLAHAWSGGAAKENNCAAMLAEARSKPEAPPPGKPLPEKKTIK